MTGNRHRVQPAHVAIDGDALRTRRKLHGLTITELAQRSGISWGYLSQVERGRGRVSPPVFVRLCDALAIRSDERQQLIRSEQRAAA